MNELFDSIYRKENKIFTSNNKDKRCYYNEESFKEEGIFYRSWNPYKSKIGAGLINGIKDFPITNTSNILYLGSSTGTTVSHISDIAKNGKVFTVDLARDMMIIMMHLVYNRKNIYPIFENAQNPQNYSFVKNTEIDIIIQDIACRDQIDILIKNSNIFLKKGGKILLALKTQCINSSIPSETVMKEQEKILRNHFNIKQIINLEPYEKDHWLFYMEFAGV